ncbi:AraC family transcriptional regulator [Anaerorhabdus sp.]|uniref:AraC family transcriptional regulator n=1 Tax=Anaerorhabdus sp. TaxID=1872524 RepID=UPI002B1EB345|nr:AraC family transcriptional regulator [Anaerorhabdus sp.]MEA4875794.1 AraC family transcriptional regulator [Anaerorhabdus sp.]
MKKETRTIVVDDKLNIEAYLLEGIVQPFPNHFHDFYVIGLMERGHRYLNCRHEEYSLMRSDMILFNPNDNHGCAPLNEDTLYYRGININSNVMLNLVEDITGERKLPRFTKNVIVDDEAKSYYQPLHEMIMNGSQEFEREEYLYLLLSHLLQNYAQPFDTIVPTCNIEVEKACAYIEENYAKRISLDDLCEITNLSKSSLLRAFTKVKGVTPYRYLEAIRINESRKLLEKGLQPIDVAQQTGFSDQSHFTNYFNSFTGLTPGAYRDIFTSKGKTNDE